MKKVLPNSFDYNFVKQFPEIFEKYSPLDFSLESCEEESNFDCSGSFLYASKKTEDLNILFSAVQRLFGEKHVDFYEYLKEKENIEKMSDKNNAELKKTLKNLFNDYIDANGMNKAILNFYKNYIEDKDKKAINSKICLTKNNWDKSIEKNFEKRIKILIDFRNQITHKAEFPQLPNGRFPLNIYKQKNRTPIKTIIREDCSKILFFEPEEVEFFIKEDFTFQVFYEITRKGMATFWLKKYEDYLENGGREMIQKRNKILEKQKEILNKKD